MKFLSCALLCAVSLLSPRVYAGMDIRVTRDRVNLRSLPNDQSEVVSQASKGEILAVEKEHEGDWIGVAPPSSASLYVYAELVKDGVVTAAKAQVRAGPGISYRAVGVVESGDKLVVREDKGEWLKVAPPAGCIVWVNRKYVEPVVPVPAAEKPKASPAAPHATSPSQPASRREALPEKEAPSPRTQAVTNAFPAAQSPAMIPFEKELIGTMEQGKVVRRQGVVGYSGYVLRRPSRYILVMSDAKGRDVATSYLYGVNSQFEAIVGRSVVVAGKEFWVQGVRSSVIIPDHIAVVEKNQGN